MQLYPSPVRPPTYLCPSLNIHTPNISFFPNFSSFAHEPVLAQHIAMTTSNTSAVPKLCDNCQRIDFSAFLPWAELEFPDASCSYSGRDRVVKNYIREPGGSLSEVNFRRTSGWQPPHHLYLGSLEAIVARKQVRHLCHFIATTVKKSYERELSSLSAVSGLKGACDITLSNPNLGRVFTGNENLPYRFKRRWSTWEVQYMDLSCW
jgi:hypothetical protein